ncbi:conserved Plasmodium protein, unknown function [Plasmodium ovale]|uniref:Uncharacterized protein n=1 Tax=Plasmodium ovale TaxID=36330 RepID=A0A1C3KPP6_PLAOA|nr:conserved Plasmodium protein, unknown function [Plasmodium ovale]
MEDHDVKQALFRREHNRKGRINCGICKRGYRKFMNAFLTWEIVLLLVHALVFMIIIYKYIKDKKLSIVDKNMFRSFKSTGHFAQGLLFVLLLVPFHFTEKITKLLIDHSKKRNTREYKKKGKYSDDVDEASYADDADDGDITGETMDVEDNVQGDIEEHTMSIHLEEQEDVMPINSHEQGKKLTVSTEHSNINNMGNMEDQITLNSSHTNKSETEEEKQKALYNEISTNKADVKGPIMTRRKNKRGKNCISELFVNKLIFPVNTPKYKREEIENFFLCAKLFSLKNRSFLFVLKYVFCFILMFAYPLYNLIKRKLLYNYFYYSSYYINALDFGFGILTGTVLVFIYGLVMFLIRFFYINRRNENFYFYDNYAFINDIKCICDERIWINIKNNPHLKNIAINYFNSYYNYKNLLFVGLLLLLIICLFSFFFTFSSLSAYEMNRRK